MDREIITSTKENAEHTLDQVTSWVNSVDTKASYALSLTSILTGFILIQGIPQAFSAACVAESISISLLVGVVLVFLLYLSSYVAILLLVYAIMARVSTGNKNGSHLFFGHISKRDLAEYVQEFTELTEDQYINELLEQIHTNSKICMKKISFYQRGIYALIIAISLCFLCCLFQLI